MLRLQFYLGRLDTHCLECDRESVFKSLAEPLREGHGRPREPRAVTVDELLDGKMRAYWSYLANLSGAGTGPYSLSEMEAFVRSDRAFQMALACTRDAKHQFFFFFRVWQDKIAKVGQSASLADLQIAAVKKYRTLLGDDRFRELTRAIGLHAHGVGIGAFVYLCRIFEDLISAASHEASKTPGWDQEAFARGRMDDKMLALKGHLPDFLVENRGMYSILSRGIHDLSEQDCLAFFAPVRAGIELILDEGLSQWG